MLQWLPPLVIVRFDIHCNIHINHCFTVESWLEGCVCQNLQDVLHLQKLWVFLLLKLHPPFCRFWIPCGERYLCLWFSIHQTTQICRSGLFSSLGMVFEVLGTLIGATLHGQIVAGAHTSSRCIQNETIGLQQNSSEVLDVSYGVSQKHFVMFL